MTESEETGPSDQRQDAPVPFIRCGIGGLLMGLANLVPGVSGGTMILIIGLYDEFVSAVADVTRLKFTRRGLLLLGTIAGTALLAIVSFAGPLGRAVVLYPVMMYSLFIGMTLGGAPMLWRMIRPMRRSSVISLIVGILLMAGIAAMSLTQERPDAEEKARIRQQARSGEFQLRPDFGRDFAAGVLGMSAMVLPGISGAYLLLLLGRYEPILVAIAAAKEWAVSFGQRGDPAAFEILLPVAIGVIVSIVAVTNILKWLLHRHERPTIALLLGVLLGSVVMLFGMIDFQGPADFIRAGAMLVGGFIVTILIGRIGGSGGEKAPG